MEWSSPIPTPLLSSEPLLLTWGGAMATMIDDMLVVCVAQQLLGNTSFLD